MHISLTYHHLTNHIVPGPQSFSYFIPFILLPIALLIPRATLPRWQSISIFFPTIVSATIHAWRAMGCVDVISTNALLWSLFLLVLKDPWEDFTLLEESHAKYGDDKAEVSSTGNAKDTSNDTSKDGALSSNGIIVSNSDNNRSTLTKEKKYPPTLRHRIPWIFQLLISIRLNNWKINLPSHDNLQPPPPAFPKRRDFVYKALLSFCRAYIILDLTSAYTTWDPYFTDLNVPITAPLPPSSFRLPQHNPLQRLSTLLLLLLPSQLLRTTITALQSWTVISQIFYLPCLLPLFLNFLDLLPAKYSPHTWAPYFGPSSSIFLHGIRGFWGGYWHQTMRYSCSAPGYALADGVLGVGRGNGKASWARYGIIAFVTFGLSGVVHMGLVPPRPLHARVSPNAIRLDVAAFFWLQPVGMMAEVLFVNVLDACGFSGEGGNEAPVREKLRMLLNAVWVIWWFSLCLPLLGEAGRQLGYSGVWLVPVSLWKAWSGEGCVMWAFLQRR